MTDIAATNVTLTRATKYIAAGILHVNGQITVGNGVLTYPSGGIPLDKSRFGFAIQTLGVDFTEETGGSGIMSKYDVSAGKLRLYEVGTTVGVLNPYYENDMASSTKPSIALTHNADPVSNLAAAALYGVEGYGASQANVITLQSTTASNANVLGETANGVGGGAAASCRFFVKDSDTPAGVALYVNEASSDRLEFVSPTGADGYIVMPFEAVAGAIPGFAIRVTVHHSATAASGKALYFDDNGAAGAQLCFVDTGAAGGTVPATDVVILGGFYGYSVSGNLGVLSSITEQSLTELDAGSDAPAEMTFNYHAWGF